MKRILRMESTKHEALVKSVSFICILSAPLWVYGLFFPFPSDYGPVSGALATRAIAAFSSLAATLLVLVLVLALQLILIRRMSAGDRFIAGVMVVGFLLKLAAVSAYMFMVFRVYDSSADAVHYFGSGVQIVNKF